MNKIRCIIVDDEPVARKIITEFVSQVDFLELCGSFENAVKADAFLQTASVDLMFLDIEMPKLSGLDFLKASAKKPLVIITTAYPEFALEGFELDVIDYLVKPIPFSRFFKAVQRAKEYFEVSSNIQKQDTYFFVRSEKRIEKFELKEILYIESLGNYVTIHTEAKKIITYLTLKGIEAQLPTDQFIKVHHSFIVNLFKITAIEGNEIKLKENSIPISRSYKDQVMQIVDLKILKR